MGWLCLSGVTAQNLLENLRLRIDDFQGIHPTRNTDIQDWRLRKRPAGAPRLICQCDTRPVRNAFWICTRIFGASAFQNPAQI